jgi:alkylation response protein AidB-like acyl-CoA dehydrogenase
MLRSVSKRAIRSAAPVAALPRARRCFSSATVDDDEFAGARGYNLALSDEQNALKELARSFALNEMIPVAAKYDKTMEFPQDVFEKAWELGLVNTHVPEDCGGARLSLLLCRSLSASLDAPERPRSSCAPAQAWVLAASRA